MESLASRYAAHLNTQRKADLQMALAISHPDSEEIGDIDGMKLWESQVGRQSQNEPAAPTWHRRGRDKQGVVGEGLVLSGPREDTTKNDGIREM